jgi:hypothetical protein
MFTSCSATSKTKLDPQKYKWYVYDGRTATFDVGPEYDMELKKGDKFGIKRASGSYFLIDGSYLYVQFKLKPFDAKRILTNSKSYSGKIGRVNVVAGQDAGKDRKRLVQDELTEVRVDSSMLQNVWYNSKKSELLVQFPNGAEWTYKDVSALEVKKLERSKSQGAFFNRFIKGQKESERFEHA